GLSGTRPGAGGGGLYLQAFSLFRGGPGPGAHGPGGPGTAGQRNDPGVPSLLPARLGPGNGGGYRPAPGTADALPGGGGVRPQFPGDLTGVEPPALSGAQG